MRSERRATCDVRRATCGRATCGRATCGRATSVVAYCLLSLLALCAPLRAEIIDRVLAVVSGGLVLQSDAIAAIRLTLVDVPATGDRLQAALDKLIERRLVLVEVDRYRPPEPSEAEVDAAVAAVLRRIPGSDSLDAILRETGYTAQQLRLYVRDDERIRVYLQQRFGASLEPTEDEIVQYYRTHESAFARGGEVRPFGEVRGEARSALIAERRATLVREWIAGLRRRADVNVLYLPAR